MKDHRIDQEQKAEYERRPFIEDATLEQFRARAANYPAGSVHYWATGKVYGPPQDKRTET
jgi:hypothetical protein|uniref:Uncharacterized protein n=1 Tax=viral metagenome TaxID=1070528 RepID=A0A6H1ZB71_9ZZZZ